MNAHPIAVSAVVGYFFGSIPFGYLLVRAFSGADVRTTGSGNIGATNVARTSPALGLATLLLDVLKGVVPVYLVSYVFQYNRTAAFVAACAAICGHIFPVWLRFRGGKGVATGLGAFLLLAPKAILLAVVVFLAFALVTRYISLASIAAAASLPVFAVLFSEARNPPEITLISCISFLIVVKHHKNVRRLLSHVEPKFHLKRT